MGLKGFTNGNVYYNSVNVSECAYTTELLWNGYPVTWKKTCESAHSGHGDKHTILDTEAFTHDTEPNIQEEPT